VAERTIVYGDYTYALVNGVLCRWFSTQPNEVGREKVPDEHLPLLPRHILDLLPQRDSTSH